MKNVQLIDFGIGATGMVFDSTIKNIKMISSFRKNPCVTGVSAWAKAVPCVAGSVQVSMLY